ncbi:hypothetical protein ACSJL3_005183 (plasmid) [Serratia nevei]|uniref:helix-turn-helix transcriptional regulator n=1 Tax=Serratia nevei TaxID=2703794 RepID=UPI003F6A8D3C
MMPTNVSSFCSPTSLWVVDRCLYGRAGLVSLLQAGGAQVEDSPTLQYEGVRGHGVHRCLVLRLPSDPVIALRLVLSLPEVPWHMLACDVAIILSPFRSGYLLRVMGCLKLPCAVQVLDARLPAHVLCDAVLARRYNAFVGTALGATVLQRLSVHERRVLCESLLAWSAHSQAKKRFVSVKTVYAHRARALAKLGVKGMSGLVGRFAGFRKPCVRIIGQREPLRRRREYVPNLQE